jgi:putative hydrolase of the HAD superfamily
MRSLTEIRTWIFDLDNTLYPTGLPLFRQVNERIVEFIRAELGLPLDEANALRRSMFLKHGATLRGLMTDHGIEPRKFLDFVHDIDLSELRPAPDLDAALAALPGRKFILTNSIETYAVRVLDRIGISRHFSGIQDLHASEYLPKPDPSTYRDVVRRFSIAPEISAMLDDVARNLPPAAALGMTTVWIRGGPFPEDEGHGEHIHHVVDDLVAWLSGVSGRRADRSGDRGAKSPA